MIAMKVNPIARQTGSTKSELCDTLAQTIHENVNVSFEFGLGQRRGTGNESDEGDCSV